MNLFRRIKDKLNGEQNLEKLVTRGLVVGTNFKRMGQVIIDPSHCWHITIGDDVTLAPRVHILAHDASTKTFLNYTKVGNVSIGNQVFVGAGTIILPNVTIGDRVVIGAGSVVTKDIPSDSLAVGNPAKVVCSLPEYLEKERKMMKEDGVIFDESYTLRNKNFSAEQKRFMVEACEKHGKVYVE